MALSSTLADKLWPSAATCSSFKPVIRACLGTYCSSQVIMRFQLKGAARDQLAGGSQFQPVLLFDIPEVAAPASRFLRASMRRATCPAAT